MFDSLERFGTGKVWNLLSHDLVNLDSMCEIRSVSFQRTKGRNEYSTIPFQLRSCEINTRLEYEDDASSLGSCLLSYT